MARSATVHGATRVLATGQLSGSISVPPSKSYTHRAVLMASLAVAGGRGRGSRIRNPLLSRDTNATVDACAAMGAEMEREEGVLTIVGTPPRVPDDVVNVENSGTTLRFMTSAFSLAPAGYVALTGDSSIRRRPMQPLLETLGQLGVQAWSSRGNGCAPVIVKTGGMRGGKASIRGDVSSQFISSLLISTPMAEIDTSLRVADAVSRPYIEMTLRLAEHFGVKVRKRGYSEFDVASGQEYRAADFSVPADFSSASFIVAAVAMIGGKVRIENLDASLPQGDARITEIARLMGAKVAEEKGALVISSDGDKLHGGTFDLGDTPDLLPVVAALALRCDSPVEIVGTAHARFKETDRIAIVSKELSKLGANVREREDGLRISPQKGRLEAALMDAHDDHRMFMAFSLASMLIPGGAPVVGAESLDVSYPTFLEDMKRLGAKVKGE
ncbi:MAG TPA: 3-phosphoshikimate 1-carboxyvinyltransferase [Nitrososphaerales archaeon]|nr:3-phosphoshikimate 1-carboxyvinyltransferase [Nitrososphaerales archaeon]